jgi:hypothetical protein
LYIRHLRKSDSMFKQMRLVETDYTLTYNNLYKYYFDCHGYFNNPEQSFNLSQRLPYLN